MVGSFMSCSTQEDVAHRARKSKNLDCSGWTVAQKLKIDRSEEKMGQFLHITLQPEVPILASSLKVYTLSVQIGAYSHSAFVFDFQTKLICVYLDSLPPCGHYEALQTESEAESYKPVW